MFSLEQDAEALARCRALLSADERSRADRFHFPRDQRRYTLARAALRELLGLALGVAADSLRFDYGAHGKPALAAPFADAGLRFNVSHSGERALIGLSRTAEIGVDIEALRDTSDQDALVRRYFSDAEIATYFSLEVASRRRAFFNCWSRKEALVKALGQGLAFPLREFDVTLAPGEPARLARLKGVPGEASGWCLAALDAAAGYAAAVVTQGRACAVTRVS